MLYFIPSWYHGNEFHENEQSFYSRRMVTEFDDTVKQVQLFNRNHIMDYQILNLSFSPNFRHFLHRQSVFHAPYFSVFDAIQEIKTQAVDTLSFHDLAWPKYTEFVYTDFCVIAYVSGQKYAEILFGEDGNMIQVDLFQKDVVVRKNIYDDRGFLSCTQIYQNNKRVYEQFLGEDGKWKFIHFFGDDHIEINNQNNMYNVEGQTYIFRKSTYTDMSEFLLEVLNTFIRTTKDSDIFCMAMHPLHNSILEKALKDKKTILSFYKDRSNNYSELSSMISNANYVVTDTSDKITRIKDNVESSISIIDITPFDTRVDFGVSQQLNVQNILVPVDGLDVEDLDNLILLFAQYFNENEHARIHFFTRNAMYNRADQILNHVQQVLIENRLDARLARKEDDKKAEFDLDGENQIPIKFYVDQCVDELSISKCIRLQRIMVDITKNPDLYLQISSISTGIPMLVRQENQYVHHGQNGFIIDDLNDIPMYLSYYLNSLTNWNKAMISSYEIGKVYNTKRLIQKWKEVTNHVQQD